MSKIEFNGKLYFSEDELRCKGTGKLILAEGFPEALLALRIAWGRPMIPNSVCRALSHNRKIGSMDTSYHVCDTGRGCCAVDFHMTDAKLRGELVALAWAMGWSVGINATFVHLDRRVDHGAEQLMFTY